MTNMVGGHDFYNLYLGVKKILKHEATTRDPQTLTVTYTLH